MQKGRWRGVVDEEGGKVFQQIGASRKILSFPAGQFKLVRDSMVRVKGNPVIASRIGLWGCPDAVVPMPTEKRLLDLVKSRQLCNELSLTG